ncbi:MAG: phosphate signaling complex protein PhoU [Bacteroidota bacterium]
MIRHFEEKIKELKTKIIKMGSLVEESIDLSIKAVLNKDHELANKIIFDDGKINIYENEIEKDIIEILALQTPVASDLRFVLSAVKINNELERIGDHAVNIAESAIYFSNKQISISFTNDLQNISILARGMLKDTLDSFIHLDLEKSEEILTKDDAVDQYNKKIFKDCVELIKDNPEKTEEAMGLIRISKNLERVADLTTNIAEEVIYIVKAKTVKHHNSDLDSTTKKS